MQCCTQKCFFPALYCTLGTATVLTHGEPRTMRWHCCYYPNVWGSGWRHRSIPKKTTQWHGCGRRQITPLSQQPWGDRALGLGSPHWSLDLAEDITLCRVPSLGCDTTQKEGPRFDQAGTQCSKKLKISVITHLQALTQQQLSSWRKGLLSHKSPQ